MSSTGERGSPSSSGAPAANPVEGDQSSSLEALAAHAAEEDKLDSAPKPQDSIEVPSVAGETSPGDDKDDDSKEGGANSKKRGPNKAKKEKSDEPKKPRKPTQKKELIDDGIIRLSRFKGVSWGRSHGKWQAQIQSEKKKTHLGFFDSEEEAARKYDEYAVKLGRHINFPSEGTIQSIKGARGGSSRFKGVSWHKVTNKWEVGIKVNGRKTGLGHYEDEEEAARKYDEVAAQLGRPLNFPDNPPTLDAMQACKPLKLPKPKPTPAAPSGVKEGAEIAAEFPNIPVPEIEVSQLGVLEPGPTKRRKMENEEHHAETAVV